MSHCKQLENWRKYMKQLFWMLESRQQRTVIPESRETSEGSLRLSNFMPEGTFLTLIQRGGILSRALKISEFLNQYWRSGWLR